MSAILGSFMYYSYISPPATFRQWQLVYDGNETPCSSSCIFPVRKWSQFISFSVMKQPISVWNPWLPSLTGNTNRADRNIHTFPKVPVEEASGSQRRYRFRWKHTSAWSKMWRDEAGDTTDAWESHLLWSLLIFRENKTYSGANFRNAEEEKKIRWVSKLEVENLCRNPIVAAGSMERVFKWLNGKWPNYTKLN